MRVLADLAAPDEEADYNWACALVGLVAAALD